MSNEESKAVARRYFAAIDAYDLDGLAGEVLAANYRLHFDGHPELDIAGAIGLLGAFLGGFAGLQHTIVDQVADGGKVASRITVRGRHHADFQGIPPTGKEFVITATNVHHVEGGKVVEQWVNADSLGMLQQLGVIPTPGGDEVEDSGR